MARRERGVALITAMLVVTLVATVATYLSLRQNIWLHQTQNYNDLAQAEAVLAGALDTAVLLLTKEAQDNPDQDHLGEQWAQAFPAFPAAGGAFQIRVRDAQSKFNLNSLQSQGGQQAGQQQANKNAKMFRRLLQAQGLEPDLADALMDWLDDNSERGPQGAEEEDYLALAAPYRPANGLMQSIEELRLVMGFDAETVKKLLPFVTVLPKSTDININTASPELIGVMFQAALDPGVAASLLAERPAALDDRKQPFANCQELSARLPGDQQVSLDVSCVVKTEYFEVEVETQFGRLRRTTQALVHRPQGKGKPATVVWQRQYIVKDWKLAAEED